MATNTKRAALYLRVSTDGQTTDNQRLALTDVAERRGWEITKTYEDTGISGAKGRDKRPQVDAMLKDATRRRFDILMTWAVDRLGRSTAAVTSALEKLHEAGVDVFVDRQAVDTTTPHGKAMFQMAAVFGELERSLIRERIMAGLTRARSQGKKLGRPMVGKKVEDAIRTRLAAGQGILKIAKALRVGVSTVQRVRSGSAHGGPGIVGSRAAGERVVLAGVTALQNAQRMEREENLLRASRRRSKRPTRTSNHDCQTLA